MRYELPTISRPHIDGDIMSLLGGESPLDPQEKDPRRRIRYYACEIAAAARAVEECAAKHDFDPERVLELMERLQGVQRRYENPILYDLTDLFPPGPLPWERPRGPESPDERPSREPPILKTTPAAGFPTDDPRRRIHHCTASIAAAATALKDYTAKHDFDPERVLSLLETLRAVERRVENAILYDLTDLFPPGPLPWERPRGPESPDTTRLDQI
jgi:hypothetical protein